MNSTINKVINRRPIALLVLTLISLGTALLSLSKTLNSHGNSTYLLEYYLGGDLYLHFICALLIALMFIRVLTALHGVKFSTIFAFITISSFCLIDESLQTFSSTRTFSWLDITASLSGIIFAVVIAYMLNHAHGQLKYRTKKYIVEKT